MSSRRIADLVVVLAGGALLLAALGLAAARARGIDVLPDRSLCWSQLLLGRTCPGCGLTRSFITVAGGDLARAAAWNPIGPILFVSLALLVLLHALRLAGLPLRWLGAVDLAVGAALAGVLAAHTLHFYLVR
ncbi:MAG TPA: DUF2752 domain-containing protein [Thermoanaerobaculia bacterium]|nr:DUF2752 domain-containing protein [Thermoanaerobaculia bacterium]